MPDRVLRAAIHSSDRFLGLPDHTCRLCYLACISAADDLGNFQASHGNLKRLWRDYGPNDQAEIDRVKTELGNADLVRWYELSTGNAQKLSTGRFGHIPRWRQRVRYLKRANPRPPADTEDIEINEELQKKTGESQSNARPKSDQSQASAGLQSASRAPAESNRIESTSSKTLPNSTQKRTRDPSPQKDAAKESPGTSTPTPNGHVNGPPPRAPTDWRSNPNAAASYGQSLGAPPMPGESLPAYVGRLDRLLAMLGPGQRPRRHGADP
jgi:hypothetical protein